MNKNGQLFFALLRNALWHGEETLPIELSHEESSFILQVAEEQTVLGLVVDALIRNDIRTDRQIVFKCIGMLERIREANRHLNRELALFVDLMQKSGMEYSVVKGQTIATMYPDPLLRQSGDIDFLVKDYRASSRVISNTWGIAFPERLIEKEIAFEHKGVTYELHTSLIRFGSLRHQHAWQSLIEQPYVAVKVDGIDVQTLHPTANIVYIFVHLFFHFIREGVGLRQLCDWAVVLQHYRNEIDKEELAKRLQNIGLYKAYKAFGCILVDEFGVQSFPFELTEHDRSFSADLLHDILCGGNFGHRTRTFQKSAFAYKMETFWRTVKNCRRYFLLAPIELSLMIPRLVLLNMRLLLH